MAGHDRIVVGGSAGGVEALLELVRGLPRDLPAAVLVVVHMGPQSPLVLPDILNRAGHLPASAARDNEEIRPGHIYVAQPDYHLVVSNGNMQLSRGPKENRARPAVDPLFRSAALYYGPRVIGVVLSGSLDDGTAGLRAIKLRGGLAVVQDPEDALFPGMPSSAQENVAIDYSVPAAALAPLLMRLAQEPAEDENKYPIPEALRIEARIAQEGESMVEDVQQLGKVTYFTCPDCHGSLWEVRDGALVRFRCQTGHAFSIDTLMDGQDATLEEALWSALRALREKSELARRVAARAREHGNMAVAVKFEAKAEEQDRHASALHQLLLDRQPSEAEDAEAA